MADYDLTLYYNEHRVLKALPGAPSTYGMTSAVAIIHCVNFDATAEEIQQLARQLLSKME